LACAEGGSAREIAARLGGPVRRGERWRGRFLRKRLKGLGDLPRRGHAPTFKSVTRCEVIALMCEPIGQKNTVLATEFGAYLDAYDFPPAKSGPDHSAQNG